MNKKQRKWRNRILVALALFAVISPSNTSLPLADLLGSETAAVYLLFALYLVPLSHRRARCAAASSPQHQERPGVRREPAPCPSPPSAHSP